MSCKVKTKLNEIVHVYTYVAHIYALYTYNIGLFGNCDARVITEVGDRIHVKLTSNTRHNRNQTKGTRINHGYIEL